MPRLTRTLIIRPERADAAQTYKEAAKMTLPDWIKGAAGERDEFGLRPMPTTRAESSALINSLTQRTRAVRNSMRP